MDLSCGSLTMVARLGVDQDHGLRGDDSTIPVDLGHCLSGKTHGTDGVVSASLLDNSVNVGDCLLFKASSPGILGVRVVSLDIFVGPILPCLSFLSR